MLGTIRNVYSLMEMSVDMFEDRSPKSPLAAVATWTIAVMFSAVVVFFLIGSVATGYRFDRTPSCGRSQNDLQPTLSM